MLKFDVIQVFINASAAIGISVLWFEFSKKVFKTVCRLAAEPFYWPNKDCGDEEEEE